MLGLKKKTVLIIVLITVAVFAMILGSVHFLTNAGDDNIKKYSEVLSASLRDNIHFKFEIVATHRGETPWMCREHYIYETDKLEITTYPEEKELMETHRMFYDGKAYTYSIRGDDIEINMSNYVIPTDKIPDALVSSYYSINGANVTYEETDSHYIFMYDNIWRKNEDASKSYNNEEPVGKYTSATSVAYLDKEWNLEKFIVTEKWKLIDENGEEIEGEEVVTLTYYDTSDEEIQKVLEDEYDMMMTELYGPEYEENN